MIDKKILDIKYGHIVNEKNISKISKKTLDLIFLDEEKKLKEAYIHNVIEKWVKNKKNKDLSFNARLLRVVKRTGIELTEVEKHNLFLFEEQIFSKDRHIKIIEVNNELLPKEVVGVKFEKSTFYKIVNEDLRIIDKGVFLISNKRFFFTGDKDWEISHRKVQEFMVTKYGLEIISKKGVKRVIKIHDLKTLNNTINNFFKIR